jgi:hypothetical protein
MFTKNKKAHAVDIDHGLNLGGIEVIREMEGNKKGCMGLVGSSGTIRDVHKAVEREMMSKVSFKLIIKESADECHQTLPQLLAHRVSPADRPCCLCQETKQDW